MLKRSGTFASDSWDKENRRIKSGLAISVSFILKRLYHSFIIKATKKQQRMG
ncbi:hypothetical protein [Petrimonas sp.]|uniref:hypothetical protein n=1 Tax=Petrimonas TaxID=307628 RepID=UPI003325B472|nr:hypothetical protein [Petrimonas sp.]